jgi:hypothetical protein
MFWIWLDYLNGCKNCHSLICWMSVPVFGENHINSWWMGWSRVGLACMRNSCPPCSVAFHGAPSAGGGLPKSQGDYFQSQLEALLPGTSLLLCALQMLSRSKSSSNWLTRAMWSASLSTVASCAQPNGRWHCCGPHWLDSTCFTLPVDQKLVVGLEMHCGSLPQIFSVWPVFCYLRFSWWWRLILWPFGL